MSNSTTTTSNTPPEPPLPPPPGTFVTQRALLWVPMSEAESNQAMRAARQSVRLSLVPFSALATLKILLPEESADLIVSPFGARIVQQVLTTVLRERMGGLTAAPAAEQE